MDQQKCSNWYIHGSWIKINSLFALCGPLSVPLCPWRALQHWHVENASTLTSSVGGRFNIDIAEKERKRRFTCVDQQGLLPNKQALGEWLAAPPGFLFSVKKTTFWQKQAQALGEWSAAPPGFFFHKKSDFLAKTSPIPWRMVGSPSRGFFSVKKATSWQKTSPSPWRMVSSPSRVFFSVKEATFLWKQALCYGLG